MRRGRENAGVRDSVSCVGHHVVMVNTVPPVMTGGVLVEEETAVRRDAHRWHHGAAFVSHPPEKPARRSPFTMEGFRAICFHTKPVRRFSIMMAIGP